MSARSVIAAVMAEACADVEGLTWDVGKRPAAENNSPPRADWIPERGPHRGPQSSGHNPRPLANRWVTFSVRCWGADHDAAEAILEAVVRGAHLALTRGGYELGSEEWVEVGALSQGEAAVLSISLGLPVLDRPQPTARATTVTTTGDITP